MELLGNANWWLPRWLERIVPRLSVEVDTETGPIELEAVPTARASEPVPVS